MAERRTAPHSGARPIHFSSRMVWQYGWATKWRLPRSMARSSVEVTAEPLAPSVARGPSIERSTFRAVSWSSRYVRVSVAYSASVSRSAESSRTWTFLVVRILLQIDWPMRAARSGDSHRGLHQSTLARSKAPVMMAHMQRSKAVAQCLVGAYASKPGMKEPSSEMCSGRHGVIASCCSSDSTTAPMPVTTQAAWAQQCT